MKKEHFKNIVKKKDYIIKSFVFEIIKKQELDINDALLLIFFLNQDKATLDIDLIQNTLHLNEKEIMTSYSNLSSKHLIKTDVIKKGDKIEEIINLDDTYNLMYLENEEEEKIETNNNIYETFEQEFARTLSPTEYELINGWVTSGINEELIVGALKEATYNGVCNLRYIDKIIYEWNKKGFKNMDDVNNHLKNRNKKEFKDDGFDYNWLDDDE